MKRGALVWLGLLFVVCVQSAERSNQNTWKDEDESKDGERIYHDAENGLTVLVSEEDDVCWLAEANPGDLEALLLENFRSQNQDSEDENEKEEDLEPNEEEVKDMSLLGPTISAMCEDKTVFWLFPKQEEDKEEKGKLSRTKRGGRFRRRRFGRFRRRRFRRFRRFRRRRFRRFRRFRNRRRRFWG